MNLQLRQRGQSRHTDINTKHTNPTNNNEVVLSRKRSFKFVAIAITFVSFLGFFVVIGIKLGEGFYNTFNKSSDDLSTEWINAESNIVPSLHTKLAMGATMLNEGLYILEWITFHLHMGFERFYLADNGSTDNTIDQLESFVSRGIVKILPFGGDQIKTYNKILRLARSDGMEWLCLTDVDAFVYSANNETIHTNLMKFNKTVGSVGVSLLNFDHNGYMNRTNAASVVERFTHRRKHDHAFNGAFSRSSSIHRINDVVSVSIHNPIQMAEGKLFVDVEGRPLPMGPYLHGKSIISPHNGSIRINHYYCKSKEEFQHKNARNRAWKNKLSTWDVRCIESWKGGVNDTTILRHLPYV